MTWFLDLRADKSGGGVANDVSVYDQDVLITPATMDRFLAAIDNRDLLFATHGFNVNRQKGRASLSYWEQWQSLPAGVVYLAVLWPGDSSWAPVIDYPIEGNEAIASGNLLAGFILKNLSGAASYSFVSHSLGARMVLQTIRGLAQKVPVRRLLLMAGAIDDNCLDVEYADTVGQIDKISILSSYNDDVLAMAFPLGNFAAGILTRGSPYWHAALGREGPQTTLQGKVQAGWEIPNAWDYGHHNYLPQLAPAGPPLPLPQGVPPLDSPLPAWGQFDEWQPAWSASINSTRYL